MFRDGPDDMRLVIFRIETVICSRSFIASLAYTFRHHEVGPPTGPNHKSYIDKLDDSLMTIAVACKCSAQDGHPLPPAAANDH